MAHEAVADLRGGDAHMAPKHDEVGRGVAGLARLDPVGHGRAVVVDLDTHADTAALPGAVEVDVEQRRVEQLDLEAERSGARPQPVEQLAVGVFCIQRKGLDFTPGEAGHVGGLAPLRESGFEAIVGRGVRRAVAARQAHLQADAILAEHVVAQLDEIADGPLGIAREAMGAGAQGGQLARQILVDRRAGGGPRFCPGGRLGGFETTLRGPQAGERLTLRGGGDAAHRLVEPGGAGGGRFARSKQVLQEAHGQNLV
jgi:hypothetical protein